MTFSLICLHQSFYSCYLAFHMNISMQHFGALAKVASAAVLLGKTVSTYLQISSLSHESRLPVYLDEAHG